MKTAFYYPIPDSDNLIFTFFQYVPKQQFVGEGLELLEPQSKLPIKKTLSKTEGQILPLDIICNYIFFNYLSYHSYDDVKIKKQKEITEKFNNLAIKNLKYYELNYNKRYIVPTKRVVSEVPIYDVDELSLFSSPQAFNEQIKKYTEQLQKYKELQNFIDQELQEITSMFKILQNTVLATTKEGLNFTFEDIRNALRDEFFEQYSKDSPSSVKELKSYLEPNIKTLSTYTLNEDFKQLFKQEILPGVSMVFVPFSIRAMNNNEGELHVARFYLSSQQIELNKNLLNYYLKNGLNNEPMFLNEEALKNSLEMNENLGNAYFCIEQGKIKDIRFDTPNTSEHFKNNVDDFLIMIEKDKLLKEVQPPNTSLTIPPINKNKIKI